MTAAMIGPKGRAQKEGEVVHVLCDRIIDHGDLLRRVGALDFPHRTGAATGQARGHARPGRPRWKPSPRDSYWPPHADGMDPEDVIRVKSHDFRSADPFRITNASSSTWPAAS